MDLENKKNQLIDMISLYLKNKYSLDDLNKFSWELIDYFSTKEKENLPPLQDFEKEFWYAIWQIQFIADSAHEEEGITKRELKQILAFLKQEKKLPSNFYGSRP